MSAPPAMIVSFVRHTHVPSVSSTEHTPDLSCHSRHDTARVITRLADFADVVATGPAERARATAEGVADAAGAPLVVDDNLKERELADSPIENFDEATEHLWANPNASYPGDEPHIEAQARGVAAVDRLVETYPDRHVVAGTHAMPMALVFNAYDPCYGREFWTGLTTPDVYEVMFMDGEVFSIIRTQTSEETACEGDADRDLAGC